MTIKRLMAAATARQVLFGKEHSRVGMVANASVGVFIGAMAHTWDLMAAAYSGSLMLAGMAVPLLAYTAIEARNTVKEVEEGV